MREWSLAIAITEGLTIPGRSGTDCSQVSRGIGKSWW
jgi:hypothetical protein